MSKLKVLMLCGKGHSSRILYHGIKNHVDVISVIQEEKSSKTNFLKRRVKKLGLLTVVGQVLFMLLNRLSEKSSSRRISEIVSTQNLDLSEIPNSICKEVYSINDESVKEWIAVLRPEAIVVNGTRILTKSLLDAITVPIVNTHMGITPKYRGVHGGYWALANEDFSNCGVTVHFVDSGIDTGGVLKQAIIQVSSADNFNTYPYLQIGAAIPIMRQVLNEIQTGTVKAIDGVLPSKLYSHPTLWGYLATRLRKGVK